MRSQQSVGWLLCPLAVVLLFSGSLSAVAQEQNSLAANAVATVKHDKNKKSDTAKEDLTKSKATPKATPAPPAPGNGIYSNLNLLIDIGAQARSVTGERPSKFEESKQVREGFVFRRFRVASNPAGSPKFFRAIGRGPSERDQQYLVDFGEYGKYRTTVEFSSGRTFIHEGRARLTPSVVMAFW